MRVSSLFALAALAAATPAFAQDAGVVNVYNWSDYIAEDTLANFTAETGITVNYTMYTENEQLRSELLNKAGEIDIIVPSGSFLEEYITAGLVQPIDKSRLANYGNLDPAILATAAVHDPENAHSIPYMSFTVGIGYNVAMVTERLGADQPADSWDLVFNPEIAAKLADCGILMLDSETEIMATALHYLGLDANSESEEDLAKATELMNSVRPHIRNFTSDTYIDALAAGEACVAVGYSGDIFIAKDSAAEGTEINYIIPKEGALTAFDLMAMPSDAPNVDNAYAFIDFILRPEVTAGITDYVFYASANAAATALVSEEVRTNPGIYPPAEIVAKAFALKAHTPEYTEKLHRAWVAIQTGV
jgi:putrescine transport system substrate-binding protein